MASVVVSTQAPWQAVAPLPHAHAPFVQLCPAGQTTPQAPQLAASDVRSTQARLHAVSPLPQALAHIPAVHDCPAAQAIPQLPQKRGSLRRSTHWPPQSV
jgi:hypothetical protein